MALHTPKTRGGLARPNFSSSTTSPANGNPLSASTTAVNRKASLQALTGQTPPRTPAAKMAEDLEVGDQVNVPGDMYGEVRFVGSVRGKAGTFVGVELDGAFAGRGKNSGDVDGVNYFTTSIPGAGIFLPVHRAEKRVSPGGASPDTPTYSTVNGKPKSKFSQTVGPGVGVGGPARSSSPTFKPKRPSLPRPESPFRKPAPNLAPTPARNVSSLSQSTRGAPPRQTPSKNNLKASTSVRPPSAAGTPRPYSRTTSRLSSRGDEDSTPVGFAITSNSRNASQSGVPSFSQPLRSPSRLGSAGGHENEIQRLKTQLQERDKRLEEQAANLAEMEQSVKELSAILPADGAAAEEDEDGQSSIQLRQLLREKNEKISLLTAEFDAHRADFRSTLDSLEMASTETERVYEEQKRELMAQLEGLQDVAQSKEDFEGIQQQLKQLEELVAELEEGLEESRRGEAEARGEVEFLRGEVERGRSELKREREKAAAAAGGGASTKDLEQRDGEIRGLKAIIHSLSSNPPSEAGAKEALMEGEGEEVKRLQGLLDESRREKETLEEEVQQLRRVNTHAPPPEPETSKSLPQNGNAALCDMCQSADHETLDCEKLQQQKNNRSPDGKENVAAAAGAAEDKWCALCEKDGHLAFDCPEEQY